MLLPLLLSGDSAESTFIVLVSVAVTRCWSGWGRLRSGLGSGCWLGFIAFFLLLLSFHERRQIFRETFKVPSTPCVLESVLSE